MANTTASTPSTRKPRRKKKATRAGNAKSRLERLEADLSPTLRDFSRRVRRGLANLEKRIEQDGREARKRGARMLREASHQLGQLEARGEREWRRQSLRTRRATALMLRRLERAIEPPRKARPRKKRASPPRSAGAVTTG